MPYRVPSPLRRISFRPEVEALEQRCVLNAAVNRYFVNVVYQDLLNRPADSAGLGAWASLLDRGASRVQMLQAFTATPEYQAAAAHAPATQTDFVRDAYRNLLRRDAEPAGLAIWVNALQHGFSESKVVSAIAGSDEYFQNRVLNAQPTAQFIDSVYLQVLDREADGPGKQSWGAALDRGFSTQQIARAIAASPEARALNQGSVKPDDAAVAFGSDDALMRLWGTDGPTTYAPIPNIQRLALFENIGTNGYFQDLTAPPEASTLAGKNLYFIAHGWAPGFRSWVTDEQGDGNPVPKVWETWQPLPNHPLPSEGPDVPWLFEPTPVPPVSPSDVTVSLLGLSQGILARDSNAVVFAYSWIDDSATSIDPLESYRSEARTIDNGNRMADAVEQILNTLPNFTGNVHLIGHSHGSKVATIAAVDLHQANYPVEQLTILDSPENSSTLVKIGDAANNNWYYLTGLNINRDPLHHPGTTFVENIISYFDEPIEGFPGLSQVVDVQLDPSVVYDDFLPSYFSNAHDYSAQWYAGSGGLLNIHGQTGLDWSPLVPNPAPAPTQPYYLQTWANGTASQYDLQGMSGPVDPPASQPTSFGVTFQSPSTQGSVKVENNSQSQAVGAVLTESGNTAPKFNATFSLPSDLFGNSTVMVSFTYQFTTPQPGDRLFIKINGDIYGVLTGTDAPAGPHQGTLCIPEENSIFGATLSISFELRPYGSNTGTSVQVDNFQRYVLS